MGSLTHFHESVLFKLLNPSLLQGDFPAISGLQVDLDKLVG